MFTIRATQTPPQSHIFCNPLSVQNPYLRFFQNFRTQFPVKFNFAIPRLFCYKFFCVRWSTESARRGIYIRSAGSWSLSVRTIPPGSAPSPPCEAGEKKTIVPADTHKRSASARKPATATAEAAASSPAPPKQPSASEAAARRAPEVKSTPGAGDRAE